MTAVILLTSAGTASPAANAVALAAVVDVQALTVSTTSSTVLLSFRGDPSLAVERTATNIRRSDLEPTGRYVVAGQVLTITVPAGTSGVDVRIGLYGAYSAINGGQDLGLSSTTVGGGTTTLTADRDGLVYLTKTSAGSVTATVSGGVAVPTFVAGTTTKKDFDKSVSQFSSSPFVTLVGRRVFADIQRSVITANLSQVTAGSITSWDSIVDKTDTVYGLLDKGATVGVAESSSTRIHITNPDTTNGYASASDLHLNFPVDSNAATDLFQRTASQQWALWHEIGHTYQSRQYSWDGLAEVTPNISALAIQESLGAPNRLDDSDLRTELAQWRTTPADQRVFDSIDDIWLKLLMFDQLRRGFGPNFYPNLNQEYRVAQAVAEPFGSSTDDRQQRFMRVASKIAQRNLTPFFQQWGLLPSAETTAFISTYPALTKKIWNNQKRSTDILERAVPAYALPTGTLRTLAATVRIGETTAPAGTTVTGLGNTDSSGTTSLVSTKLVATKLGPSAGRTTALLQNSRGTRNVLVSELTVLPGTSFDIRGYADYPVATVALARDTHTLRAWSTGIEIHPYVTDRVYLAFTLKAADGTTVISAQATGAQTADALAAALNGVPYQTGQYLVIAHLEPVQRLIRYNLDVVMTPINATTQGFRIEGDGLAAVDLNLIP